MSPPGFLNGDATTNLSLPAIEQQLEALRSTDVQRDALIKVSSKLFSYDICPSKSAIEHTVTGEL